MNVHLTAELEQLVHSKVQSGRYNSASEVVREALRLLAERDQLLELRKEAIRQKIDEGWESLSRGAGVDGEAFFADLERKERARAKPQRQRA
jgi:antitoxin ParD1/3/4